MYEGGFFLFLRNFFEYCLDCTTEINENQKVLRLHVISLHEKLLFGTDPDRNGVLEETPRSWSDSCSWLSHLGVRAPYATRRKRRYEVNQVWLNTTFISQGSQSQGKLAVETWRVKTELIIITILHIIIITTSILNLGFQKIAPKILVHTKMHK